MKKILLIDDDPVTNFIHKKLIEASKIPSEISVAHSGQQALELIAKTSDGRSFPDLILLDIHMPIMGGFQFLQHLYALATFDRQLTTIAVVSSSDNIDDKLRSRELGVEHYLVKPTNLDQLRRLMGENGSRRQRQ